MKTKLGTVVIDDDKEMAKKRIQQIAKGMPEEQIREFAIYGPPEDSIRSLNVTNLT